MNKRITTGLILFALLFTSFAYVKAADSLSISANDSSILSDNKASIYYNTNLEATCGIDYSVNADLSGSIGTNGQLVQYGTSANGGKFIYHVQLSGLQPGTDYYYKVNCAVGSGPTSSSQIYKLSNPKINIQEISNSKILSDNSATVDWTNNIESTCNVLYSKNANLENSQSSLGKIFQTSATEVKNYYEAKLLNLSSGVKYYYKIQCSLSSTNASESGILEIPAKSEKITVFNITAKAFENGAFITWVSSAAGDSQIRYAKDLASLLNKEWIVTEFYDSGKINHSATPSGLKLNTYYVFEVRSTNLSVGEAVAGSGSFTTVSSAQENMTTKPTPDTQIQTITDNAKLLKDDKFSQILTELQQLRDLVKEQQTQIKYLNSLVKNVSDISSQAMSAINNFITYGVDANTKKLGQGERAAVINSYKSAFDKLPQTEAELADAIKIANGRFPSITSDTAEKDAKDQFIKIYKRSPDLNNPKDNAAIKVMAYGLRQKAENRNLNSERAGIKIFANIFGHAPQTTEDWNTMQAITYSGASR